MPQMNSDEASIDEPKTYTAENFEEDQRWHESDNLSDIKGDLVGDLDVEARLSSGNQSKSNNHTHPDPSKDSLDRDAREDNKGPGRPNYFPRAHDFSAIVSGLNGHPLFPNGGIPPSSKVSPYHPYNIPNPYLLYGTQTSEIDSKTGLPRTHPDIPSMYPLPGNLGQIPHPLAPWVPPASMYPMCTASTMASIMQRYQHPFAAAFSGTSAASVANMPRFPLSTPPGMHPASMLGHPALGNGPMPGMGNGNPHSKLDLDKHKHSKPDHPEHHHREKREKPDRPYVKKPLNAFMLYMKEQRAKVVAECTLKESAAINQILGRKWHSLSRDEQQKYYEMARKERQLHMQLYPGWSARDNYGKRKKRKKEKSQGECTAQNSKKCRAVFGLDQQHLWCAPCRRKKKCIRYQHDDDSGCEYEDADSPIMQDTFNQRSGSNPFDVMSSNNNTITTQQPIINGDGLPHNGLSNGGSAFIENRPPSNSPPMKVKEEMRNSPDMANNMDNNFDQYARQKKQMKHSNSKSHENSLSPITNEQNMGSNNNNSNNGMYHPAVTNENQMTTHRNSSVPANTGISQHNINNSKSLSCNTMSNSSVSKAPSSTQLDSGHSSSMSSNSGGSPTSNRTSEKTSRLSDQTSRDFTYKSTNGPSTPRMHSHSINPSAPNPFLPPSSGTSPLLSPNSVGFNPHSPRTSGAHHPFMPPFSPYFQMQLAANFMAPASPLGLPSLNGLSPMMGGLNAASPGQG